MNEMKKILLPGEPDLIEEKLPSEQSLLFAPIDKRAFGVAIGTVCALMIVGLTAVELIGAPNAEADLSLLAEYFAGYTVSWAGAVIGGAWAFAVGFCAGWFTAFVRNLVLALSLFMMRSRAELDDSRDFLDHI
jgi:hypothetical protein